MALHCAAPSAANTAASIALVAESNTLHRIESIQWSYDGSPTAGRLTVTSENDTLLTLDLVTGGPGFLNFAQGLFANRGKAMTITLAAAGTGVHGKLNVQTR